MTLHQLRYGHKYILYAQIFFKVVRYDISLVVPSESYGLWALCTLYVVHLHEITVVQVPSYSDEC